MIYRTLRLLPFLAAAGLLAQPFDPKSSGEDGDLTFPEAKSGDVIIFNPKDTKMFPTSGLDKENDNVFHFKTITIPAGVRVVLRADLLGGPVYFLAQNDITILGHLDADGNNGNPGGMFPQIFAVPGPGGFHGGAGGDTGSKPSTAGFGPVGGAGTRRPHINCDTVGRGGGSTVNEFLVPLVGGSGGGGWEVPAPQIGAGGGGGGGAILLATKGTIRITGVVTARGGRPGGDHAGYGGGGSIRLAANRIEGNGQILTNPVNTGIGCAQQSGSPGRFRLEAFQNAFGGTTSGTGYAATPFDPFLPGPDSAAFRVLTIAGVAVSPTPTGRFDFPDVTINSGDAVPVVIETRNVPVGTIVRLQLFSESATSQTIEFPPLTGAGPVRTATANVVFPTGFSRGMLQARFTR